MKAIQYKPIEGPKQEQHQKQGQEVMERDKSGRDEDGKQEQLSSSSEQQRPTDNHDHGTVPDESKITTNNQQQQSNDRIRHERAISISYADNTSTPPTQPHPQPPTLPPLTPSSPYATAHDASDPRFNIIPPKRQQRQRSGSLFHPTTTSTPNNNNNKQSSEQQINPPNTTITYRERLGGYLHPRDMRRLVTPFSSSNEPELIIRRHVMLLNFDPLRAIVLRDRLLVLVPAGADSILISLEKSVRGGIAELQNQVFGDDDDSSGSGVDGDGEGEGEGEGHVGYSTIDENAPSFHGAEECILVGDIEKVENANNTPPLQRHDMSVRTESELSINGDTIEDIRQTNHDDDEFLDPDDDDEWGDIKQMNWIEMSFELQSVDAVLSLVCKLLSEDSMELRQKILNVMERLRLDLSTTTPGDHIQDKLRILKDEVKEMDSRVQGFVRAMNHVLNDDEDMALMNLSRILTHPERFIQPVSQEILNEESDEPELILEAYLQQALSEVNALELLKGNILNTEELVSLQMDTVRNRLLYINTLVSVISLCVASASLIGSIFGMNLKNSLEDDDNAFLEVVLGTIAGCVMLLILFVIFMIRVGLVPPTYKSNNRRRNVLLSAFRRSRR